MLHLSKLLVAQRVPPASRFCPLLRRSNAQSRQFFGYSDRVVPNTGPSTARDILAVERTFLAWARTGLGFVGGGSALAAAYHKQGLTTEMILPASALLIGNGAFLLLFATRRYGQAIAALQKNEFPVNAASTLIAVVVTSINTMASLWVVWRAEMAEANDQRQTRPAPEIEK